MTRDPDKWPMVGQDRRRAAGAGYRRPGRPGRALGSAGRAALRQLQAARDPAQDRAHARRSSRGPVRVRGPADRHARHYARPPTRSWPTWPRWSGKLRGEDPPAKPYHPAVARRKQRAELRRARRDAASGQRRGAACGRRASLKILRPSRTEPASRGSRAVTAAVMGAGNWGTTFAQVLCDAGTQTVLWCRRPEVAESRSTRPA